MAVFTDLGTIYSRCLKSLADISIQLISPDGTVVELADFTKDISVEDGSLGLQLQFGANAFPRRGRQRDMDAARHRCLGRQSRRHDQLGDVTIHGRDGTQAATTSTTTSIITPTRCSRRSIAMRSRLTLTDTNGGVDWLDLAAMSGDVVVRLTAGEISTGTSTTGVRDIFKIAAGTVIENAVTGDGNDKHLRQRRGKRALRYARQRHASSGGGGADTLSGGAGNDTLTGGADQDIFLFDRALNAADQRRHHHRLLAPRRHDLARRRRSSPACRRCT